MISFPQLILQPIAARTPILVVVFALSYIIVNAFTAVYTTAIDTLLLCYCEEKEYSKNIKHSFEEFARKSVEDVRENIEIHVMRTKEDLKTKSVPKQIHST